MLLYISNVAPVLTQHPLAEQAQVALFAAPCIQSLHFIILRVFRTPQV